MKPNNIDWINGRIAELRIEMREVKAGYVNMTKETRRERERELDELYAIRQRRFGYDYPERMY